MASSFGQIENIALRYPTDAIFILGKGPSADLVDPGILANHLTITINDAEKIARGDIGVLHANWVVSSLQSSGFSCSLYVSSIPLPDDVPRLEAEYVAPTQFNTDLLVERFHEEQIYIEDVMLITAIKIAKIVADFRMRRQKVYLVGFDFSTAAGYSKRLGAELSGDDSTYQSGVISAQEHYLLVFMHLLRDSNVHLMHVGSKSYSSINARELNTRLRESVAPHSSSMKAAPSARQAPKSDNVRPDTDRVLITAEITTNHFGDRARLEKMIRRAKDAGADLVKLQRRDVETFYTPAQLDSPFESPFGKTFREYRHALELKEEDFWFVDSLTTELGIGWFASVLDWPSFEFMMRFEPALVKLPSTISKHTDFLAAVARNYRGSLVISTGFTDQEYEDFVLSNFSGAKQLYLLQCTSAYPTPPDQCNIAVIRHYRDLSVRYPNVIPGYSSHDFGSTACMLAVAAGAKMVEKHVKFGNAEWAHFDGVAVDLATDAFHQFVEDIRMAQSILGREQKTISDVEHHKYWPAKNTARESSN